MSQDLSSGAQIGRYRLETAVGRGGMGVVYRGLDPALNRPAAIKLLAPHLGDDPAALRRFHREAALVASLKHPHIAVVYEYGEHSGRPFIALEWIEGRTLKDILAAEGRLPLERCLRLCAQLAAALDYAHSRGVIHRDLKPANILVGPDDHVTLVDFGLAWIETAPSLTVSDVTPGTPLYMSPEQVLGQPVDARADLYSLAVITYEMLAGQPPFAAANTGALLHQQLYTAAPPVTETNPSLPPHIEHALSKALSKDAEDRFAAAADFLAALENPSQERAEQATDSGPRRWVWGALAVAILGLSAMLALPSILGTLQSPAASPPSPSVASTMQATEPAPNALWPATGGDATHTGFVADEWSPPAPEPRWRSDPAAGAPSGMVAGAGRIVFAMDGGVARALDLTTGALVWETSLGADVQATPTLYPDPGNLLVLFPSRDGELYALALIDRQLLWRMGGAELGGGAPGGASVGPDGEVYVGTSNGKLHVLDPLAGKVIASSQIDDGDAFRLAPALTPAAVYLAGETQTVYALDRAAQEVVWRAPTQGRVISAPLAHENWGTVLVGTDENWVHAFSMAGGKPVWQAQIEGPVVGLAADPDRLYAISAGGVVHAWDGRNGHGLWRTELHSSVRAAPITNGVYVVVGTETGEVRYLSAETGAEADRLRVNLGEPVVQPPVALGGWLFVRTDQAVYGLGP